MLHHDILFRLILGALTAWLYVDRHVIQRKPAAGKSGSRKGVRAVEFWIVLTAASWTLSLILYVIGIPWFDRYAIPLPLPLRWAGVAAMSACIPLSRWIYAELGRHFRKKLEIMPNHQLVCSGPYRYVRHPMYATLFLCGAATSLISANGIVAASVLAVVVAFLVRMKKEDEMLIARFGDEYREYKRRTRAIIPKFATLLA